MEAITKKSAWRLARMVLILFFTSMAGGLHAQTQSVTMPGGELTVERIIGEIETQTNLIVGVNHRNFDVSRKIRPGAGLQTVKHLLDEIVRGTGHTYISRGAHVIIVREDKSVAVKSEPEREPERKPEPVPFEMRAGTIALPEEEVYEPGVPQVREYKTVEFAGQKEFLFYVTERNAPVSLSDIRLREEGESVAVEFTVVAGAKAVGSMQALKVTPILQTDTTLHFLPGFALEGKRYHISQQRRARSRGETVVEDSVTIRMNNGDTLYYREIMPDSLFVPGTELTFESDAAICLMRERSVQTVADNFVTIRREVIMPEIPPRLTTGELIAKDYAFVEQDPGTDLRRLKPERQKALTVYYELDKYDLRFDYRNNNYTLSQMLAAINIIKESDDSEITHVVLTGYASPEGPVARNERLAGNRSRELRDFITKHTGLDEKTFIMHNGGSDWDGLAMHIGTMDVAWKNEVLKIIEDVPQSERMRRIRQLDNGQVYQYLLTQVFPDLRNAAYIKVYYRNKQEK
ncbi:hypothetical protein LJC45_00220 [Alistipes sp. OttesenSCG-928-B03]|nr:hypothetical protein [Alistipes sp. OttesenSCG-928-B03]